MPDEPKPSLAQREPVSVAGAVALVAQYILGTLVAFGVDLSQDQERVVLGLVNALTILAAVVWARRKVSPT